MVLMLKVCWLGWCIVCLCIGFGFVEFGGDGMVGGGFVKKVECIMRIVKVFFYDGLGFDVFELLVCIVVIVIGVIVVFMVVGIIFLVFVFVGFV